MSERFYIEPPITAATVSLAGPEAHHLAHVMRAQVGDRVSLFDGSGAEFEAEITRLQPKRSEVELRVLSRVESNRELPFELTLAVALPKGDRQRWLIEKVVELGVTRFVPLETARGVAQPVPNALDRLRRQVIEASKQCGRNRLMEIAEPRSFAAFATEHTLGTRLIAHPGGTPLPSIEHAPPITIAIGPEGGFTDQEVQTARQAGWRIVTFGDRILRTETAAVAAAAWTSFPPARIKLSAHGEEHSRSP